MAQHTVKAAMLRQQGGPLPIEHLRLEDLRCNKVLVHKGAGMDEEIGSSL